MISILDLLMLNYVRDFPSSCNPNIMSIIGELSYFLGLQVKKTKDGIFINQAKYTINLLRRFGMQDNSARR